MKVREILDEKGRRVVTARAEETLLEAARRLATERVGALIVVNESRAPVGVLSERDIVRMLARAPEALARMPVGEAMTREVIFAAPNDEVEALRATMTERRVRHLPIVTEGTIVGIVSIGDVLKALRHESEVENHHLKDYIAGKYLD
ncbi:MAG TPA: CBS domain-containing protein [Myxococcales bacterium]|jgi:CBS domain-containing protein